MLRPWIMISLWALTCLSLGWLVKRQGKIIADVSHSPRETLPWWLWVQGVLVCGFHALVATAAGLSGPPGMGIYGYRAKLWWLLGRTPEGFYASPGYDFCNPDHPPGWSLVTLWHSAWQGCWEDHWVKLWVPICLFLSWRVTVGWMRRRGMPWWCLAAPAAFMLCDPAIIWSRWYYGEALLLLLVLTGLLSLFEGDRKGISRGVNHPVAGLALLACAAWIKNEGLIYWIIGACMCLWMWPHAWRYVAMTLPLATGWRVLMILHGAHTLDFDWHGAFTRPAAESWTRLGEMAEMARTVCFMSWRNHFGLWWLLPLIVLAALIKRGRLSRLLLIACVVSALLLWAVYYFSALPMKQHAFAFRRVLTIPAWLLLMAICSAFSAQSTSDVT